MKRFLYAGGAVAVAMSLSAPLALAQTATHKDTHMHASADKSHAVANGTRHDTKTDDANGKMRDLTAKNTAHDDADHTTAVQHGSPWAPNGNFVQGHTPGDNRLPIYTQQGLQHAQ